MPRIFATLHLVAFLCEFVVRCCFLAAPFSSSSSKDSDDDGEIKMLEYVCRVAHSNILVCEEYKNNKNLP